MNKTELITAVAEKAGLSRNKANETVDAVMDSIREALTKGDKVSLVGFATFGIKEKPARKGRNPRTGETIEIPARQVPFAKVSPSILNK